MPQSELPHGQYHQANALVEGQHGLRGFHPSYRIVHALGRIYRGTFTASGDGAALTRAVHFQPGATVPATARFSSSAADPEAPLSPVAAIAVKFYLDNGTVTDLVALNLPLFQPTPDDYLSGFAAAADPATKARSSPPTQRSPPTFRKSSRRSKHRRAWPRPPTTRSTRSGSKMPPGSGERAATTGCPRPARADSRRPI
jgi:hypothetical protein